MTAWFLNSNSHSNDQNISRIKWSILSLTTGFYLRNCWLEKSRCQIYSCSEFTAQCHSWPSHQPWHWTDHRVTTQIKTSEPTKQRIRERDLHVWAPRPPWHDWVLPGGPGFPDTDIPELLLTNQWPVFWRVTNEEPGSFVWSSGTFHPSLVYCTITSNYPHQVNNAMLPSSENMITKAEGLKQLQLCIYTWKGGSKEDTNSREGLVNASGDDLQSVTSADCYLSDAKNLLLAATPSMIKWCVILKRWSGYLKSCFLNQSEASVQKTWSALTNQTTVIH